MRMAARAADRHPRRGWFAKMMSDVADCTMLRCNKDIERLLVRSYVWVLNAPRMPDGQKVASLSRHGFYEVRLIEPSDMLQRDCLPFWVELFDNREGVSIDSHAGDDIEEAAAAVKHLIAQAELLDQNSTV
jgi:hypothetical protein